MPLEHPERQTTPSLLSRVASALAIGTDGLTAGLLFFTAIHYAVTTLRCDRGWSEDLAPFGLYAFGGLFLAALGSLVRKRVLPDGWSICAAVCLATTMAYFAGRLPVIASYSDHGRPPEFRWLYLGATFFGSAAIGNWMPKVPVFGAFVAALLVATPATRYLMRTAPEGFEVAPISLALAALVHARLREPRAFVRPPLAVVSLLFGAIVIVAAACSISLQSSIPAAGRTAGQILAFLVLAETARRERWGTALLAGVAATAAIVSLSELWALYEFSDWVGWDRARRTRLHSYAIHPNLVAPFSMFGAVACLGFALATRSWALRGLAVVGAAAGAAAVAAHRSAGASVGLAAGVGMLLLGAVSLRWKLLQKPLAIGTAAVPIVAVITAVAIPFVLPSMSGGGESGSLSVGTRREFWSAATRAITAHPVLGLGPRNTESHAPYLIETIEANQDWTVHPHNLFLEVAETCGLPALAAFIALIAGGAWVALAGMRGADKSEPRLAVAGLAILTALAADWFFDHGFPEFAVLPDGFWWTLAILIAALPQPEEPNTASASSGRWWVPGLAMAASLALLVGGTTPLVSSGLDRSAKWLKQWISWSPRYDGPIDPEGRLERMRLATQITPYRPDFQLALAEAYILKGDAAAAIECVHTAARVAPENAETLLRCGGMLIEDPTPMDRRDPAKALEYYKKAAIFGNPEEHALARMGTARALGALGRIEECTEELGVAIGLNPALMILPYGFRRGPGPDGKPDVTFNPAPNVVIPVFRTIEKTLAKLRARAGKEFDAVWAPMARIAEVYARAGRTDRAVEIFQFLIAAAPTPRMNLHSQLAQYHILMKQYAEALKDVENAEKAGGHLVIVPALRARIYDMMGRPDEARKNADEFYNFHYDAEVMRAHARDTLRTYAYSLVSGGRGLDGARVLLLSSRFEETSMNKVILLMEAATESLKAYLGSEGRNPDPYLSVLTDAFSQACDVAGALEWGEMDGPKLTAIGREFGAAAGARGRSLFNLLMPLVENRRALGALYFPEPRNSPGPFLMAAGVGEGIAAYMRRTNATQGLEEITNRCTALIYYASNLGPRPSWKGN